MKHAVVPEDTIQMEGNMLRKEVHFPSNLSRRETELVEQLVCHRLKRRLNLSMYLLLLLHHHLSIMWSLRRWNHLRANLPRLICGMVTPCYEENIVLWYRFCVRASLVCGGFQLELKSCNKFDEFKNLLKANGIVKFGAKVMMVVVVQSFPEDSHDGNGSWASCCWTTWLQLPQVNPWEQSLSRGNNVMVFFFLFAPCNTLGPAETHLETSLRSGRNFWENSHKPSQLRIRSFDHSFGGIMGEPLVQS